MSKKPTEKQLAARKKFSRETNRIMNIKDSFWGKKGEVKERTFESFEKKENSKN